MLGCLSAVYGSRVTLLRLFLAVGGVASFTSWSSLALQGIESLAAAGFVVVETALGVTLAGLGHLVGWKATRR